MDVFCCGKYIACKRELTIKHIEKFQHHNGCTWGKVCNILISDHMLAYNVYFPATTLPDRMVHLYAWKNKNNCRKSVVTLQTVNNFLIEILKTWMLTSKSSRLRFNLISSVSQLKKKSSKLKKL